MFKKSPKVAVLMSGGVDSSCAAALLQKQGYPVTGFFMIFGNQESQKENQCCNLESEEMARTVASCLQIPFYTLNLSKQFRKEVVANFLNGYGSGVTPNPCIICNEQIKFGVMLDRAQALGFDYVATGHYIINEKEKGKNEKYSLSKAKDTKKDQSYFLYTLTQEKLEHLLFPLGKYQKTKVRKIAQEFNLPVYDRKESQDLCFLSGGKIQDFIQKNIKTKKGQIINIETNAIIGEHQGLSFYTKGQRQGICIGGTGPYYVAKKDFQHNILYVCNSANHKELLGNNLIVSNVNWISGKEPKFPFTCEVQIRYNAKPAKAKIIQKNENIHVLFSVPQRAITPGQSAVFYQKDELLGGGIIQ